MNRLRKAWTWIVVLGLGWTLIACGGDEQTDPADQKKRFVLVANTPDLFWKIAGAGVRKAEKEFDISCKVELPPEASAEQQQEILNALMVQGVDGIAISPVDPKNMTALLNRTCEKMLVICQDSDAPESNRLAYVGTNNVAAGRQAGQMVLDSLPKGTKGRVIVFVGNLDAQNAVERLQGLREALAGSALEVDPDPRLDGTDSAKARTNVEAVINSMQDERMKDVKALVGLWAYNGPAIAAVVKEAGWTGQIAVVCFDEHPETLQAVQDGIIYGTVVQDPFRFGYLSMKILYELSQGDTSSIPENKIIYTETKKITKKNVEAFWKELKSYDKDS